MTTTRDQQNVAGGGSLRAGEREDSDAGGNPGTSLPPINAEPSCVGLIRKALYVLNMNFYKDRVRYETKMRHLRELRDACQGFVEWHDRMINPRCQHNVFCTCINCTTRPD